MELFAITCTTCKSRLKVRDPAAIGQILSCPKCGGMVMVKPPPAFSEIGDQKSDLPTATEVEQPALAFDRTPNNSAFDVLDELLSDAPPRVKSPPPAPAATPVPAAPTTPKPRFVGGPPVHRSATPPNAKASATPAAPVNAATVQPPNGTKPAAAASTPPRKRSSSSGDLPVPTAETAVPPPIPDASPPAARPRSNYWMLMAGSIVLGTGLALVGVCAVILLRPTGHQPANATKSTKKPAASSKKQVAPPKVTTAEPGSSPASPAETASAKTSAAKTSAPSEPGVAATSAPQASVTNTGDPLGLTTNPAPTPPPTTANPANDPLAKFDSIIGGPGNDPLAKPPTAAPEAPLPAPATETAPVRPIAPRPPPREIDVAKGLAVPLLGIESTSTTLADFTQLVSNISTIPITLDVPFPPITPESPIVLKAANTTVGKALTEALAALTPRLEYVVSGDQLIVRRPEPTPFVPLTLDVKDLTAGDEQQTNELVELLQAVIEPGSWGDGEGQGNIAVDAAKGSLAVRHRRTVQFQVLIAVEKLRAAHSPPLPFKKLGLAAVGLDSRLKQAGPKLEKRLSLNYGQPTRLTDILDRIGQATGVRILVDWRDVATAGWNPAGEATLVASNQPLVEALDALLTPLDLDIRIIDGQILQVVTPARLADQGELEFYKAGDLITGETTADALIAKVRAALGDETFIAGGGNGEIRFDDTTKCLLAWLPQPKQRELEVLLATWRSKGK